MKQSSRERRWRRHQNGVRSQGRLLIVAILDLFCVLMLLLVVSSTADNQLIQNNPGIVLPDSTSYQSQGVELTVVITDSNILLNGQFVMTRASLVASGSTSAIPLTQVLTALEDDPAALPGRRVIIQAERELPYALLRKVMAACIEAGYSAISLEVTRKSPEDV